MWQLEEEYWHYVSTGDIDAYVKLSARGLRRLAVLRVETARKGDIGKWVRDIRDNKWKLTYQLKPLEMQEFGGNTVVVHYAAEYVYDYGDGTQSGVDLWRKFTYMTRLATAGRSLAACAPPRSRSRRRACKDPADAVVVGAEPHGAGLLVVHHVANGAAHVVRRDELPALRVEGDQLLVGPALRDPSRPSPSWVSA